MGSHNLIFLFLLLLLVVASAAATTTTMAPSPQPVVGAYTPIRNLSDPHLMEVAKFAVEEHNKRVNKLSHKLQIGRIIRGWSQVVAGVNYRLIISAKPPHRPHAPARYYQAVVFDQPWKHFMKLTFFRRLVL